MDTKPIKYILHTFFIILFLFGGAVQAADIKLGYVNITRLLKEAPQADVARKKLEDEFAPRDRKIVEMQKNLKKMEESLLKQPSELSELNRKKLERQVISLKRDIKRSREEFTEDLNIRRNEELNKLQKLVHDAILSLAKEKQYDLILGDSALFASDRVDITDQVLSRLKQ